VIDNEDMVGIYNCSAPTPVTNTVFMREMRTVLKPLIYLPSPKFLLNIGAYFIKTETELVLKSRWVIPKKLMEKGFVFKYPTISNALKNILE
jgi:NAD dependent epimerase/dehydratase family enzyme